MKIKKVVSSLAAVTMALSSFAALSVTAGAEEAGFSKTVDLQNAQTTFNRVVVKGDNVPEDLTISVVDENGTESTMESTCTGTDNHIEKQLVKSGDSYGLLLISGSKDQCKYVDFTGKSIKISSDTNDVSGLKVEAYEAEDVSPTHDDILNDGSLLSIKAIDAPESENADLQLTNDVRFNNPAFSAAMRIDNALSDDEKLYGTSVTPYKNTAADITLSLNGTYTLSQVNYGNVHYTVINKGHGGAGKHYELYYYDTEGNEQLAAEGDTPISSNDSAVAVSRNHMPIKLDNPITTNKIRLRISFLNPDSDNKDLNALNISYIGSYEYGDNLVAKDTSVGSNEADLGEAYTFNKLTSEAVGTWQYKNTDDKWVNIPEDGSDVTTQYIRVAGEDMVDKATPAFELSWEGNLVKYANEQKNGASLNVDSGFDNNDNSKLYDGITATNSINEMVQFYAANGRTIKLDFYNASAKVNKVEGTYATGCYYPIYTAVLGTNNDSNNTEIAYERNTIRLDDETKRHRLGGNYGYTATDGKEHNDPYVGTLTFENSNINSLEIKYEGSMRSICDNDWRLPSRGNGATGIRIIELEIPGSVDLVSYDGTEVTVPKADGELTEVKEASATYGNEVKVSADDSSDKQNAVGYVVTFNPNGSNSIKELGVQATNVTTDPDSVKKRVSSSVTFDGITGNSEFVFGFAAIGVDKLSNIVVTADGEAVSTTQAASAPAAE